MLVEALVAGWSEQAIGHQNLWKVWELCLSGFTKDLVIFFLG